MVLDHTIVLTEPIAEAGTHLLQSSFKEVRLATSSDDIQLCHQVSDAKAIVTRLTKITRNVIESAPELKLIVRHGVGVDNIDIAAATEHGVQVVFTPEELAASVAEFTIGVTLSLLRRIREADVAARAGNWNARDSTLIGTELAGKTFGIIGLGRIGLEVAKRLKPFEIRLLYYDVFRRRTAENRLAARFVPIKKLLTDSDAVSLHVPASAQTFHLIGSEEFAIMKRGAVLINMSRGSVVDEKALIEALTTGQLSGAALDVFEFEPLKPDSPLTHLSNVLLSPHMSAHTKEALDRTSIAVAKSVIAVLSGRKARHLANPEVLKHTGLKHRD